MGYGQPVPPGRFSVPPLFPQKRGGQGASLGKLFNRRVREERNVLFLFLCALCVLRGFKEKCVKMNFDDPGVGVFG